MSLDVTIIVSHGVNTQPIPAYQAPGWYRYGGCSMLWFSIQGIDPDADLEKIVLSFSER